MSKNSEQQVEKAYQLFLELESDGTSRSCQEVANILKVSKAAIHRWRRKFREERGESPVLDKLSVELPKRLSELFKRHCQRKNRTVSEQLRRMIRASVAKSAVATPSKKKNGGNHS